MSPRVRSTLTQTGSLALAALLLWLALRGVDFGAMGEAFRTADYRWAVPLVAALFLSHLLRAWRWTLLLRGLDGGARVTLGTAFGAVLVGYMVNYAAPRLGEVARTGIVARRAGLPVAAVLGTVVLDRLLDVGMLLLGLATVPFLLGARRGILAGMTANPVAGFEGWLAAGAVLGLAALALGWRMRHRLARTALGQRLGPLLKNFAGGIRTLRTAPRRGLLVGLTLAMWGLYVALAFVPFEMLGHVARYGLTVVDGWCVMLIGALGQVVPSPGGAGSYHYVTIEALTRIYGLARPDAASYAVLAHGAQLVLYVVTGAVALVALAATKPAPGRPDGSPRPSDASAADADGSTAGASAG